MTKVIVDKEKCIGCGTCIAIAVKTFRFDKNGKAEVIEPSGDTQEVIKEALDSCPVSAIESSE